MPADRGVAFLLFLALLVVGVLSSWDAPEAFSQAAHRHGRRASGQGSVSGQDSASRLRAGRPPDWTYAVAAAVEPGVAAGHGEHDRTLFQALYVARHVAGLVGVRPARGVLAVRSRLALSIPGHPAPSSRAPPVA